MTVDDVAVEKIAAAVVKRMAVKREAIETEQRYSVERAAVLCEVSEATIWREIAKGKASNGKEGIYPTEKLGHRQLRIPASALNRYLERRRV